MDSMTGRLVRVHIDEGASPLGTGIVLSGRVSQVGPESRPPENRHAVIEPMPATHDLAGHKLIVSPRYETEGWREFTAGHPITVNVSVLDMQNKEVAQGIGTLYG